ncbi:class I SAM-dependent methyltransferase [Sphingobacterium hungaricum]|uniref:Methyltransferase type 11 domain-containing protein n=1 Tax=Sphingobacterium hungaricum TaxID=2082723 RepID=A0A928UYR3_9SPHI|nr:class I SAM-dependent methyltransferase [Sphingobacterium hungaricum]MBE8715493.1 hypothetical protein [Sphingobacterium hungaricum]
MLEEKYKSGAAIYGDDFTISQIQEWYEQEEEAYADLGSKDSEKYAYGYHQLNLQHGFRYLPDTALENVLGLGAAWGHEFFPIADRITNLHIIEPSENLRSEKIKNLTPIYKKPSIEGAIDYPSDYFDLVTCFGTIHHIPNVSFVLSELCRVAKPGGYILLREPVVSMGDWTKRRAGLTKNERGIPLNKLQSIFKELDVEIVHEGLCFCMTPFLQRIWKKFSSTPIYSYKSYILFDKWLSKLFANNLHYHATKKSERIAPQSVYYVLRKK